MEQSPYQALHQSREYPHFMETEGSLSLSQQPTTCPYPKPEQSSPCPIQPTSWNCILILYPYLRLVLQSCPFPSVLPTNTIFGIT